MGSRKLLLRISPTDPQEPHMVSALLTFVTAFCYWCETSGMVVV